MLRLARERRKLGTSAAGQLFWQEHITGKQKLLLKYVLPFTSVLSRSHFFIPFYHLLLLRCLDIAYLH
jgi:hypothetical protein